MPDMKKLLSILSESTVAGSVASTSTPVGSSPLARPKDTIFAAENDTQSECDSMPKSSPSDFGLWKNSKLIGREQVGKHGRKKMKVDKTQMYPQLAEAVEPEQSVIDDTRDSRLGSERNAGLNEPDEKPTFHKEVDFGTWHFTVDGVPQKKDGKVYYSSSKEHNDEVLAHLRKKAEKSGNSDVAIEVVQGPVKMQESYEEPKDMADWSEEDWAEWDAKVGRVGAKAKAQEKEQEGVAEGSESSVKILYTGKDKGGTVTISYEPDYIPGHSEKYIIRFDGRVKSEMPSLRSAVYALTHYQFDTFRPDLQPNPKTAVEQGVAKGSEQINELSKDTLQSYKKKAKTDYAKQRKRMSRAYYKDVDKYDDASIKSDARKSGIKAANTKLGKEEVSEDGELKRVKREYNQAAKDAGGDRPGAGKKIDDLKKRLRQRDVGKDRSVANEAEPIRVDKDGNEIKKKPSGPAPRTPERQLRPGDARSTQHGVATMTSTGLIHRRNTDTTPKPRGVKEGSEITEEMIADRLKSELDIFKKGTKSKSKDISKKPADKEVQPKKPTKKDNE